MNVINKLAVSLGKRDEQPNIELAEEIVAANDIVAAIKKLAENLHNKNKKIASDCIKVLYEVADRKPELVSPYLDAFITLLDSKDNRLVWGTMIAIHHITSAIPDKVHKHLDKILSVADKGSVITKDHTVGVLIALASNKKYASESIELLFDQLNKAANNQFSMYAEQIIEVLPATNKNAFIELLNTRLPLVEKDSQKNRITRLIKKLQK